MKLKKFKEKYSKKVNKKPVKNRKLVDYKWIITVTLLAFFNTSQKAKPSS